MIDTGANYNMLTGNGIKKICSYIPKEELEKKFDTLNITPSTASIFSRRFIFYIKKLNVFVQKH